MAETRKLHVDVIKNKRLLKKIKYVSEQYNMTEEQIWNKLILRYDNLSGKSIDNQEERVKDLLKFFTQIFIKEDFSDDDIYDNREICCIHLM